MFEAKGIEFNNITEKTPMTMASGDGRNFAVAGGVAAAVVKAIHRIDPDREVKVVNAEGLADCKKMLMLARTGKYNGYLMEGMACPGGCVGGAGTTQPIKKSIAAVTKNKTTAPYADASDSKYQELLPELQEQKKKFINEKV